LLAPRVAEKMRRIGRDRDGEDGRARGRDRVVRICGAGDGAERWRGAGHSRVMEMGAPGTAWSSATVDDGRGRRGAVVAAPGGVGPRDGEAAAAAGVRP